jgi:TonB-dependent Receptor Plug Domain
MSYRSRNEVPLVISAAVLLLGLLSTALAQTCAPGELRVFTVDSQDTPVFDAEIRISQEPPLDADRTVKTSGTTDFDKLPCGIYLVTVTKEGFEPAAKSVEIRSGSRAEVSLTLNPKMQLSKVDVTETAPPVEQTSSISDDLHRTEVRDLPSNPATVSDSLPLIPGVVRGFDGELKVDGTGEQRSAFVINQTDVTDPATGKFGQTVPTDAVESVTVLSTPFLAQYGRFTAGVIAVETRRGGEKWHFGLNDPFPDFRVRSWHLRGIRNETPRLVIGGPLIHNRIYFSTALNYVWSRDSSRTLPFPYNESKRQSINSFTQVDWIVNDKQIVTATLHVSPQHYNFVDLNYFNPQPAAASYAQHNIVGTAADHLGLFGGILDSSISVQRFDAFVGAQGPEDMIISPEGNRGNYFGTQSRWASRTEWLETYSPKPMRLAGTHQIKFGNSLTRSGDDGSFTYRPVHIVDSAGQVLQDIDFTNQGPYSRIDLEVTAFVQDHWALTPSLSFDYGARIEHQRLASSLRIAPRAGFAWNPFSDERTIVRAGYGQFYDHLPLDIYTFSRYPLRTITIYAPDGSIIDGPTQYDNVIGSVTGPRSFLVHGQRVAGAFAPRGLTVNTGAEHIFSRLLRIRATYTDNRSVGLVALAPFVNDTTQEIVLNGDGSSYYRQTEITAKFAWKDGQNMVLTYTRSRAEGTLNTFDTFLGNFPMAVIRPDVYSNLPADLPNRFLMWGRLNFPRYTLQLLPIIEYRNGFPYSRFDEYQNYVGVPNSNRFPNFFSADARVIKDFKVTAKYTVRLSLTAFNITNHFNALQVHANTDDPQYGVFFGNYHRRYRFDFEVVF